MMNDMEFAPVINIDLGQITGYLLADERRKVIKEVLDMLKLNGALTPLDSVRDALIKIIEEIRALYPEDCND